MTGRLAFLLLLLLGCAEARRHRYGATTARNSARHQQQRREYVYDDANEDGEEEVVIKGDTWQDEVYALSRRRGTRDSGWPPKWSGPVVGAAALWYVSYFF